MSRSTDPDALAEYGSQTLATIHVYSGRYLVIGGDIALKEGASMVQYPVLIEFPTLDAQRTPGTTRPSTRHSSGCVTAPAASTPSSSLGSPSPVYFVRTISANGNRTMAVPT